MSDPKSRRFNFHCRLAQTRRLMRILPAVCFLQMPTKEIEQSLHPAQLHRREAPRACRKPGLSLVVSLAPDDLDRPDIDTGEIDRSCRGSAHTLRFPCRKISAI